jgi:hypothetical protein
MTRITNKSRKAAKLALGPKDALPKNTVTRMWKAGKSLTDIARKIGTGARPNGTGLRVGRIRAMLTRSGLYPRKAGK